ncbi:MAG: alanine racemase, partial [Neisseriaceae bacterium]
MPRPIVAHISTQALQHNLRMVRLYAPHARVAAVIKASGYGHGTLRVAQALHDADAFALLNTEAAAQLRHA